MERCRKNCLHYRGYGICIEEEKKRGYWHQAVPGMKCDEFKQSSRYAEDHER
jgi:hypothetical protein